MMRTSGGSNKKRGSFAPSFSSVGPPNSTSKLKNPLGYHLMLLPGMLLLVLFSFVPMFGVIIAFEKFIPTRGVLRSPWIGLSNFQYMFQLPDSGQVFLNTIIISFSKIVANLVIPLAFALMLNEVKISWYKRTVQTIVYLPYFLSWVILASTITNILSLRGPVNTAFSFMGIEPIFFLTSNLWFRPIIVFSNTWKDFGFNTIIYLAAITTVNPLLYEAAIIDGANRWRRLLHITVPGIAPTMILLATLSLGNILDAGFDQVFNLYNPLVYSTGDIVDTLVYRIGLVNAQYGLATALGLMKSVLGFILIIISYGLAYRFANYRIF